jgi:hypothetical protein
VRAFAVKVGSVSKASVGKVTRRRRRGRRRIYVAEAETHVTTYQMVAAARYQRVGSGR